MPFEAMPTFIDGQVYGATEFNLLRNNIEFCKGILDGVNPPFSCIRKTGALDSTNNLYTFSYRSRYFHTLHTWSSTPAPDDFEVWIGPAGNSVASMVRVLNNTAPDINPGAPYYAENTAWWVIDNAGTYPQGVDLASFATANGWTEGMLLQAYLKASHGAGSYQTALYMCNTSSIQPPSF